MTLRFGRPGRFKGTLVVGRTPLVTPTAQRFRFVKSFDLALGFRCSPDVDDRREVLQPYRVLPGVFLETVRVRSHIVEQLRKFQSMRFAAHTVMLKREVLRVG